MPSTVPVSQWRDSGASSGSEGVSARDRGRGASARSATAFARAELAGCAAAASGAAETLAGGRTGEAIWYAAQAVPRMATATTPRSAKAGRSRDADRRVVARRGTPRLAYGRRAGIQ